MSLMTALLAATFLIAGCNASPAPAPDMAQDEPQDAAQPAHDAGQRHDIAGQDGAPEGDLGAVPCDPCVQLPVYCPGACQAQDLSTPPDMSAQPGIYCDPCTQVAGCPPIAPGPCVQPDLAQ